MKCTECGAELAPEDRFCGECGAPRPQASPEPGRRVPPRFAEAERRFAALRARYQAGELDDAAYDVELQRLVVEDDAGDHWVLGAESGDWYWYDGAQWARRDPTLLEEAVEPPPPKPPASAKEPPPAKPATSTRRRWLLIGCGGLVLLLIVACVVMLVISSWIP